MKLGLLGKKIGMTQVFDSEGLSIPVTVVELGENIVTQQITKERNGYTAIQVGGFAVKEKRLNKPEIGALKKASLKPMLPLQEYRIEDPTAFKVGEPIPVDQVIKEGILVDVRGSSIGKGFQGTVKRFNAARGPMAHGSKFHRSMGSIAPGATPGRVYKGGHMPGQMGNENVCIRRLQVVKILSEKNLVLIKGAVPGVEGGTLHISASKTKWN